MQISSEAVVLLMRSWTGMLCLCSDPHGMRALLRMMLVSDERQQHLLLDMVHQLLQVLKKPPPLPALLMGMHRGGPKPPQHDKVVQRAVARSEPQ